MALFLQRLRFGGTARARNRCRTCFCRSIRHQFQPPESAVKAVPEAGGRRRPARPRDPLRSEVGNIRERHPARAPGGFYRLRSLYAYEAPVAAVRFVRVDDGLRGRPGPGEEIHHDVARVRVRGEIQHPPDQAHRFRVVEHPSEAERLEVAVGLVVVARFLMQPEGCRRHALPRLGKEGLPLRNLLPVPAEPDLVHPVHMPHGCVAEAPVRSLRRRPDHAVPERERLRVPAALRVERRGLPRPFRMAVRIGVCLQLRGAAGLAAELQRLLSPSIHQDMVMAVGKPPRIVGAGVFLLQDDVRDEIPLPEYLVADQTQVADLPIVDRDENHAVPAEERPCELQTRIHHVQPAGVEPAGALRVLSGHPEVPADAVPETVPVDEIPAGVVGRIDVDEPDLAGVALPQQLESFEVVAFDEQVARPFPVDAELRTRKKRAERRSPGGPARLALAVPDKSVTPAAGFAAGPQKPPQRHEVDLPAAERFRDSFPELRNVVHR